MDLSVALLIAAGCFSVGVILGYWYGHDCGRRGGFRDGMDFTKGMQRVCKPD